MSDRHLGARAWLALFFWDRLGMKTRMWSLGAAAALVALASAQCGTGGDAGRVLAFGDAEWDRPPFDPPGGNGVDPGGGGVGEDGGGDPGGASAADDGSFDEGTSGPPSDDSTTDATTSGDPTTGEPGTSSDGSETTDATSSGTGDESGSGSSTTGEGAPAPLPLDALATRPAATAAECPVDHEPAVFYMSNDDSNSQASPILARQTILEGQIVDPFRIRIHEFLNYYDLNYDNPRDEAARVGMQMRRTDAETGEFVLLAYAQGRLLDPADRRPMNLVFSLDTSGSMSGPPIERLRFTLRAIAGQLRAGDVVSMVTWDTGQNILLDSYAVSGPSDPMLTGLIDGLTADGGTDLDAGLVTAYQLATANFAENRINRVVLVSDGGANAGVTDIDLIAQNATDSDGEGIYLVGVGVGEALEYRDDLMDAVTDAGKGAYVFIDSREEADRMFGDRFIQNMDVAARNVRMELTMPWYFAITEFHGEEYSEVAEEVDPQHLSPNDAMSYHQIITACDPKQILTTDKVRAKITYEHPISREPLEEQLELEIGEIVRQDASQLYKGDVVVAYAQSLIVIGHMAGGGNTAGAKQVATDMALWLQAAETSLDDPEIAQMRELMDLYAGNL
jgi:hypothetical protein